MIASLGRGPLPGEADGDEIPPTSHWLSPESRDSYEERATVTPISARR
ncbi:hypothetical protein Q9S36_46215 [Microbacterium sp. ARD31]|nr:hypothetical protein [Microbacterium sp. ARD31]MDT0187606.1 hypothetical protein [Microbacterium sp. ARD31]